MDAKEEQLQELEVIESIYPDELEKFSDTRFAVTIALDTGSERRHEMVLTVSYPEAYPEVKPELDLEAMVEEKEEEDDDEDDGPKVVEFAEQQEFSREDVKKLLAQLDEEAEMSVGMPVVFALVTKLKDDAEELFAANVAAAQAAYDRELLEREKQEQQKFNGTPVTPESFAEWRAKFRKEMRVEERDQERFEAMHQGKMSGKEAWEKGLAQDDEIVEGVEKLEV
ncbi:protein Gir2p [Diutina catenulata]